VINKNSPNLQQYKAIDLSIGDLNCINWLSFAKNQPTKKAVLLGYSF
jgi:hypothetical protein